MTAFQQPTRSQSKEMPVPQIESANTSAVTVVQVFRSPSQVEPPRALDEWNARACLTLAGAWMVQFCTFGYITAFGVFQDYYTREFLATRSPSNISWIGSLQLFLMYATGVFVGRAFDLGYFHHLEAVGSGLYVFSIFMVSLTEPNHYYQVFLSQGVGMGLGLGLTFLPSLSIVSHHFRRRRALTTGLVVTGASVGGIVFPIMLNRLFLDPSVGFARGVRATGGLIGGMLLLANGMMRTNYTPRQSRTQLSWKECAILVWDGAYLWSVLGAFFTNIGLFIPFFYYQLYARDIGIDENITTYCLAILNAGGVVGRLLPTFLADRLGVYNIMLPSIFTCAAVIFAIFGVKDSAGMIVVGLIFGFSFGAYISLIPSLLATLCRDVNELGVRMGLAFSVVSIAMLVGTPIAGALLGTGHTRSGHLSWWRALVFAGVCVSAGLLFMSISRMLFYQRKGRPKA